VTPVRTVLLAFVAAALAVALGVVVGAGPVTERSAADADARTDRLADRADRLRVRVAALERRGALDGEVMRALGGPLTDARLADRRVVVVATPGADRAHARQLRAALADAGATVTGLVELTPAYVDPANAVTPLEDLALRLVPPNVEFDDGASAIERVGTVLARALVTAPEGDAAVPGEVDQDAAEVVFGLREIEALRIDGEPGLPAELAVVVAGRGDRRGSEPALRGLLAALDAAGRGTVLVAPGAAQAGPLRWARDDAGDALDGVSTVDSLPRYAAVAATVLALDEQSRGGSGDYGLGRRAGRVIPKAADAG
jgi:hypothetical protein